MIFVWGEKQVIRDKGSYQEWNVDNVFFSCYEVCVINFENVK